MGFTAAFAQQVPPTLAQAAEAQKRGDLEAAVAAYRAYLATDPMSFPAHANLGAALAGLGRMDDAVAEYNAALRLDPDSPALRFNLGLAYFKSARIPDAARNFAAVLATQPENQKAIILLADCYLQMGESKRVIELLAPKTAIFGNQKDYTYLLGTAYIRNGDIQQGQVLIDQILRDGDSAEAHLMMGAIKLAARDGRSAIAELRRAIDLNPGLITVHSTYGQALMQMGEPVEAAEQFRSELKLNPTDFEANRQLGVLLKADQNYRESLTYFRRALAIHPGAPDIRYQIATIELKLDNVADARSILEDLIREQPNYLEAHVSLATAYYRLKLIDDGNRERALVLKLNAARQAKEPAVQDQLAKQHATQSQTPEAPKTALASPPPESAAPPDAQFSDVQDRAIAARESGDTSLALTLYRKAVNLRPDWAEGWWYLGSLHYTNGQFRDAGDAFRHFIARQPPNEAAGWAMLGLCEFELQQYSPATEHLGRGVGLGLNDNQELSLAARYHLALLLNRSGDSPAALEILLPMARNGSPQPSLINALGLAALGERLLPSELPESKRKLTEQVGQAEFEAAARRLQQSSEAFRKLIEQYPNVSNLHYSLGVVLLISHPDAALDEFRKELIVTPQHVDARLQIAYEYLRRDDPAKGLPFAQAAVKLAPASAPALSILGRLHLKAGHTQDAINALERAAKLSPATPEIAFALANAYASAGRSTDAAREREQFKTLYARRKSLQGDDPGRVAAPPSADAAGRPPER